MVATKKVVSQFHCWIEEVTDKGKTKFTGHYINEDKKEVLLESTGSVARTAKRLGVIGGQVMINQAADQKVFPGAEFYARETVVGTRFTADPVEHVPEDVLEARKAQIGS